MILFYQKKKIDKGSLDARDYYPYPNFAKLVLQVQKKNL